MRKKYFKIYLFSLVFLSTLMFSCQKEITGPQGNPGPSLTGSLIGHIWLYDQYGTRVYTNLNKANISIEGKTSISIADSTGKYAFTGLTTGIYNISATDSLYGSDKAPLFQFVGGGLANKDFKLSQIPTFSLASCTAIDTVSNAISYVKVRGTVAPDTRARMFVVFVSSSATVTSNPAYYAIYYSKQIAANATNFNILIPATDLYAAGINAASTVYFAAYPAAVSFSTTSSYEDYYTGKTYFNAIGSTPLTFNALVP